MPATATALNVPEVLNALERWINQRAKLDPRDYFSDWTDKSGISAYRSEVQSIAKQGVEARKALAEARSYPENPEALAEAFQRAFSGRLSWTDKGLEYCTGQYWPTEYRQAAGAVLRHYCNAVRPKFTPPKGRTYATISEIKAAAKAAGSHYFDKDSIRFFNAKIESGVLRGRYFLESIRFDANHPKEYKACYIDDEGGIETVRNEADKSHTYKLKSLALSAINQHAKGA